jgi:hypothetical protein
MMKIHQEDLPDMEIMRSSEMIPGGRNGQEETWLDTGFTMYFIGGCIVTREHFETELERRGTRCTNDRTR